MMHFVSTHSYKNQGLVAHHPHLLRESEQQIAHFHFPYEQRGKQTDLCPSSTAQSYLWHSYFQASPCISGGINKEFSLLSSRWMVFKPRWSRAVVGIQPCDFTAQRFRATPQKHFKPTLTLPITQYRQHTASYVTQHHFSPKEFKEQEHNTLCGRWSWWETLQYSSLVQINSSA